MRVALLFIDGVGVGARNSEVNPLADRELLLSQFDDGSGTTLPLGGRRFDVDTTFGVPGRPQSASNQTAILTGQPAPKITGEHLLGYPNAPLKKLITEHSVVRKVVAAQRTATFANAYPAAYLDALKLRRRPSSSPDVVIPEKYLKRIKPSASTLSMAAGGVELRTFDDARAANGLTHDIEGRVARRRVDVPERTADEAAAIFWKLSADFTLFEHYLADEAGHAQDRGGAIDALETFDRFARVVIATRPDDVLLMICSDHGNVEDLSTRNHTLNKVPVLVFGDSPKMPALQTVADVGNTIVSVLT
ncbi:MAG: metalloenzyme [Archangium sp.]|nr:metalloenzyme [Archangium sp.]